jgi:hypothetical protein
MMGIVVIFAFVSLLAVYGFYRALHQRNILALILSASTALVFGFFSIMTVIHSGYPILH